MQIGRCLCCRRNVTSTLQSGRQGAGTRRKHIESRERQTMRIPSVSSPVLHKCLRCHPPLPNRPYCIAKRPVSARGLALLAMPYGRFSIAVCPSWLCAWYSTVCPIGWPLLLSFTKCCRPIDCRVYEKPHAPALKLAYAALHVGVKTHAFGSPSGPACALQASVRLFRYVGLLKSVSVFLVYNLEHKP